MSLFQNNGSGRLPSKAMLTMRLVIGIYLIYLAYQIGQGVYRGESDSPALMIAFVVLFILAGIGVIVITSRDLMKGNYVDGGFGARQDAEEDEIEVAAEEIETAKTSAPEISGAAELPEVSDASEATEPETTDRPESVE